MSLQTFIAYFVFKINDATAYETFLNVFTFLWNDSLIRKLKAILLYYLVQWTGTFDSVACFPYAKPIGNVYSKRYSIVKIQACECNSYFSPRFFARCGINIEWNLTLTWIFQGTKDEFGIAPAMKRRLLEKEQGRICNSIWMENRRSWIHHWWVSDKTGSEIIPGKDLGTKLEDLAMLIMAIRRICKGYGNDQERSKIWFRN